MNENHKYEVIKKVVDGTMKKATAEVKLGLSRRQIDRLIVSYKKYGKEAFIHKRRGRASESAVDDETKEKIVALYLNSKYEGSNIKHFTELLEEHEAIKLSKTTVRSILFDEDILSPKAHKKTRKKKIEELKNQLTNADSKKEEVKLSDKIISIKDGHPLRSRVKYFGELLQLDASKHDWLSNGSYLHLHTAIDDASGDIVGAYFSKEELLHSYYHVTSQILSNYGIPHKFLTDYRTVFNDNSKNNSDVANSLTQFGYMCKHLGIDLECTMIPQKKGRVERLFSTLQSRLVTEFKVHGITTIDEANEFLDRYIKKFNGQFGSKVNNTTSVFEMPPTDEQINLHLAVLTKRIIHKGHHLRYNKHYYIPIDTKGQQVLYPNKTQALVIKAFDGNLFVSIDETIYALKQLELHQHLSKNFDTQPTTKQPKVYIPDFNHPWKMQNFDKFVYEHQLSAKEWEDLQYASYNALDNVDEVLNSLNF